MKKIILAVFAALIGQAHTAAAQQYVYPVYSQDTLARSQYTSTRAAPAQVEAAPSRTSPQYVQPSSNVIPLSSNNTANNATAGYSGYGSAVYDTTMPPAVPQVNTSRVPSFVAATPASAATPRALAETPRSAPNFNWSGCYGGAYIGGASGGSTHADELRAQNGGSFAAGAPYNTTANPYSYNTDTGFMGGGTFGCNRQIAQFSGPLSGFVIGMEGELGSLTTTGKGIDPNNNGINGGDTHDKTRIGGWDAIAAGRAGFNIDRTLIYGKAGLLFTAAHSNTTDSCTVSPCGPGTINARSGNKQLLDGAFGGGVEYALNNAWSVKGEYLYLNTSDDYQVCGAGGAQAAGSNFCSHHTLNGEHTFKIGFNYHFTGLFGDRGNNVPRW